MKSKIIVLLLAMGIIVGGAFAYQRNSLPKMNNKQQNDVANNIISKNKISYIDGYIE